MENLNYSFPGFSYQDKYENNMEVELEERGNLSAFNLNFLKFSENMADNINGNNNNLYNNCNNNTFNNNFQFSPPKKKNTIDISYSIEQTFCENSHINIEEEFQQNEDTCIYNII
jgi:hypothetical protein